MDRAALLNTRNNWCTTQLVVNLLHLLRVKYETECVESCGMVFSSTLAAQDIQVETKMIQSR
jgi:hypothetical protein